MDRIAVISDIHGNIPALEAVLADIARRGIERIECLGDLVGKGPQSAEAVDICREVCNRIVKGNWDDFIGDRTDNPTLEWHQRRLGPERLEYLATLPNVSEFLLSGRRVRLFHASQEGVYARVRYDAPRDRLARMFDDTEFTGRGSGPPRVVGYGDIHRPYAARLEGDRLLFNAGSVGNPLDRPEAGYAILSGCLGSAEPGPVDLEIVRLEYDIERAVAIAQDMGMPELEPYAVELRTAVYRGRQ